MNVAGLQRIGSYAALCVLGIVLYHGALKAGFYYDDRQAIVENPSIRSWASFLTFSKREGSNSFATDSQFCFFLPTSWLNSEIRLTIDCVSP